MYCTYEIHVVAITKTTTATLIIIKQNYVLKQYHPHII